LDEGFATDSHEKEPEELANLQSTYRARVKSESHLYHPLTSKEGLEASVLKLRDDLTQLRRGVRRWAATVATLLMLTVGLSIWLLQRQQHANDQQKQTNEHLQSLEAKFEKLQQGINNFAEVQNRVRQEQPGQKPAELERSTYVELAKQLGIDAVILQEQLPRFAEELKKAPNVSTYERANAAFVEKDYGEAERLALTAADEAKSANPPKNAEAIKAFELAAWAAADRIEYADALKRLRSAEELTDRNRDGAEWARVQYGIGRVLFYEGQFRAAEPIDREALKEFEHNVGSENRETLNTRNDLANSLTRQGKSAEAEAEFRELIKMEEKVSGPENLRTLKVRANLAAVLDDEGKYAEAEAEDRVLVKLNEKLFGPEALGTLGARNNLADALDSQSKYAEAEAEFRTVIALASKTLGPEDPNTLNTRTNLGNNLAHEGKYTDAEAEYRAVIPLDEKVLGLEHPDTLETRTSLAEVLDRQGRCPEAETECRDALKLEEKVLGPEHPDTLLTRGDLAAVLDHQGNHIAAETEYRAVLKLKEHVLGAEHPDTLRTCFDLAVCLRAQDQIQEASAFAQRAVDGARRVLGPDHPDTKKYEKLQQELVAKAG
jgi:tetratricopeptide (TPR) repeat protein